MSDPIVQLKAVSKWYPSDPGRRVLDGIDLSIAPGERFAIVGPSGCGKSTLLNILGTLDRPSEGSVIVAGQSMDACDEPTTAALRGREIGFIFQLHHLLPQCTALENVLVPTLAITPRPDPAEAAGRARELLGRVGLANKLDSRPSQLSGGERQRVAVVRALINRPRLLLADEPTGALDEDNAARLIDLLIELNESDQGHLALVMVTHDLALANRLGSVRPLREGRFVTESL
ncbi:MAG: ABC transporter ATP-binding protein [Verrucomicrobiales bacterium]|nr:ABC transporter ATP-binding protein [Verrucomicrobiales bacterium]